MSFCANVSGTHFLCFWYILYQSRPSAVIADAGKGEGANVSEILLEAAAEDTDAVVVAPASPKVRPLISSRHAIAFLLLVIRCISELSGAIDRIRYDSRLGARSSHI